MEAFTSKFPSPRSSLTGILTYASGMPASFSHLTRNPSPPNNIGRQRKAWFDGAVRGSSAVQAALRRLVLDESAAEFKISNASALLDVDSFYDSLDPVLVLKFSQKHQCPRVVLTLNIQLHLAPRFLRSRRSFSDVILA